MWSTQNANIDKQLSSPHRIGMQPRQTPYCDSTAKPVRQVRRCDNVPVRQRGSWLCQICNAQVFQYVPVGSAVNHVLRDAVLRSAIRC
jgi:hypothetical protein